MASYFGYGRGDALPRGRSWLRVTVLEVDPALAGRAADIELQPPLDLLKLTDLDYLWLWPFFFWKVAALFLLIPGLRWRCSLSLCGAGSRRIQQRIRIDRFALPPLFLRPQHVHFEMQVRGLGAGVAGAAHVTDHLPRLITCFSARPSA
jgi:hypothetical protein